MPWQNLRAELEEEFSQLEGQLPGKFGTILDTAFLPVAEQVQRWKKANPDRAKAINRRYAARLRERKKSDPTIREKERVREHRRRWRKKLERGEITQDEFDLEMAGGYISLG